MSSTTLSSQEKPLFQKRQFLDKTIFYSVRTFAHIRQHYFSKYWGTNAWAVPPPQIFFGGDRPPVPPRSPPLSLGHYLQRHAKRNNVKWELMRVRKSPDLKTEE